MVTPTVESMLSLSSFRAEFGVPYLKAVAPNLFGIIDPFRDLAKNCGPL